MTRKEIESELNTLKKFPKLQKHLKKRARGLKVPIEVHRYVHLTADLKAIKAGTKESKLRVFTHSVKVTDFTGSSYEWARDRNKCNR